VTGRVVYYLFEAGFAPERPLARFTDPAGAAEATAVLEALGRLAVLLSRDEDPARPRPSL
jgi:hypothetical protein